MCAAVGGREDAGVLSHFQVIIDLFLYKQEEVGGSGGHNTGGENAPGHLV